jgi:hypothetical protein
MDRNAIFDTMITSFKAYSVSDARPTVTKVLKYSGRNYDIRQRGDIKREAVIFQPLNASTTYNINDEKPKEITQRFQALVYLEQADNHSAKDATYDRLMEITDLLADWSIDTGADTISADVWTLTLTGIGATDEQDGYLSTTVTFQSIIKLQ